ncbi:MAG TPA: hypothetical protein VE620_05340 [Myxococcales bacterium]|nr:hypothetical protein [Myxococcales bacterium]
MRGAIAAACAAVMLGLLSPGAFACAVAVAARGAVEQQHHAFAPRSVSSAAAARVEPPVASRPAGHEAAGVRPTGGERVTAWHSPSAPAPSRAPPAALL